MKYVYLVRQEGEMETCLSKKEAIEVVKDWAEDSYQCVWVDRLPRSYFPNYHDLEIEEIKTIFWFNDKEVEEVYSLNWS